jgi:hypothetical protein
MKKIIGISGKKQSGKNTTANFVHGQILQSLKMIEDFYLDEEGSLVISTVDGSGNKGKGIFDITRKDQEYIDYARVNLWPHIKTYHFADELKELSITLFGLTPVQVYGTDEDKNTLTDIYWENIPLNNGRSGKMTAREFLQHFGTEIIRKTHHNAWVNSTLGKILKEDPEIAIIPDVRFPNEVKKIKEKEGFVIRLTRDIYSDGHDSEKALDQENYDWSNFDYIIDNSNGSITDLCDKLNDINFLWT